MNFDVERLQLLFGVCSRVSFEGSHCGLSLSGTGSRIMDASRSPPLPLRAHTHTHTHSRLLVFTLTYHGKLRLCVKLFSSQSR